MECMVCDKHRNLKAFTGEPIFDKGGWLLAHFPKLEGEKATKGHLLLESRRHLTDPADMNDDEAAALGQAIRLGSAALKKCLHVEHVYVFRINDKVPHLHFHLLPRYPGTPTEYRGQKLMEWPDRPIATWDEILSISRLLKAGSPV